MPGIFLVIDWNHGKWHGGSAAGCVVRWIFRRFGPDLLMDVGCIRHFVERGKWYMGSCSRLFLGLLLRKVLSISGRCSWSHSTCFGPPLFWDSEVSMLVPLGVSSYLDCKVINSNQLSFRVHWACYSWRLHRKPSTGKYRFTLLIFKPDTANMLWWGYTHQFRFPKVSPESKIDLED